MQLVIGKADIFTMFYYGKTDKSYSRNVVKPDKSWHDEVGKMAWRDGS